MKKYIRLLRVKHYIKNILIFIPLFFGCSVFDTAKLEKALLGFVSFSLLSSSVYILNDWQDIDKDRRHPIKKHRPLTSGTISPERAKIIMLICFCAAMAVSWYLGNLDGVIYLMIYWGLNIAYSMGLKDRPIVDIIILASGFVIRILYGGIITDIAISKWMYLVVITGSFCMVLGKRKNELKVQNDTRDVLKYYNEAFLDNNMYVCAALTDVFYALWAMEMVNSSIIWTVPVFIIILMRYSLDIEAASDGDPVEILFQDKILIIIVLVYTICIFTFLYML